MNNLIFTITKSDKYFVAECSAFNIVTQSKSLDGLLSNIKECVELFNQSNKRTKKISPYTLIYSNILEYAK
ncbi:MAG: hypothetical protein QM532_04220 [Cyanobium sp. MAG06]|nr:hypothetical protein [Cyanobium sp. MAG06]